MTLGPTEAELDHMLYDTEDVAYFWTREAEGALDMQALHRTDPVDMN